jgi:hypothetical protein
MPYSIRKTGSKYEVYNKDTDKVMGTHKRKADAVRQLVALKINVEDDKEKSQGMFVIKEAQTGKYRWVAFSSNAYRDKDGEIVSQKALNSAVNMIEKTGYAGPLLWWHVPEIKLGDCDFSMLYDKVLVESGTFTNEKVGKRFSESCKELEMSIKFIFDHQKLNKDGVYEDITGIIERSALPAGTAANELTGMFVNQKEAEIMRNADTKKVEALKNLLGDESLLDSVFKGADAVIENAEKAGIESKEAKEAEKGVDVVAPVSETKAETPVEVKEPVKVEEPKTDEKMGDMTVAQMKASDFADMIMKAVKMAMSHEPEEVEEETPQQKPEPVAESKESNLVQMKEMAVSIKSELDKREKAFKSELDKRDARIAELEGKVKGLNSDLPRAFSFDEFFASTAKETEIKEDDPLHAAKPTADKEWKGVSSFAENFIMPNPYGKQ